MTMPYQPLMCVQMPHPLSCPQVGATCPGHGWFKWRNRNSRALAHWMASCRYGLQEQHDGALRGAAGGTGPHGGPKGGPRTHGPALEAGTTHTGRQQGSCTGQAKLCSYAQGWQANQPPAGRLVVCTAVARSVVTKVSTWSPRACSTSGRTAATVPQGTLTTSSPSIMLGEGVLCCT